MERDEKYVDVGISDKYKVTVTKETFEGGAIFGGIFGGAILLIAILITILFVNNSTKASPTIPVKWKNIKTNSLIHSTFGSDKGSYPFDIINGSNFTTESVCTSQPNTYWDGQKCQCEFSHYGRNCDIMKYPANFTAMGNPVNSSFRSLGTTGLNRIDCGKLCSQNSNCSGYISKNNYCELIQGKVEVDDINYQFDQDSSLYMKNNTDVVFRNKVFLVPYSFKNRRYWLQTETPTSVSINQLQRIDFFPSNIQNPYGYVGIISKVQFDPEDFHVLLSQGSTNDVYIHMPGTDFKLPGTWKYHRNFYVLYRPFN